MKTKVKKESITCEFCRYLRPYGHANCPVHMKLHDEVLHKEQATSEITPPDRTGKLTSGRRVVRHPVDILTASEENIPVDLLGTDEKSIFMWCELLRDEHESKEEHLTVYGLISYVFALRSRPYRERVKIANTVRLIYAKERAEELRLAEEWEKRVTSRQTQGEAPSVAPTAGKNADSAETPAAPRPAARPGIIVHIIKLLEGASKKRPITKEQILESLVEEFPERRKEAMASTISSQIPNGLLKEKKITVSHTEDRTGWWIRKPKEG